MTRPSVTPYLRRTTVAAAATALLLALGQAGHAQVASDDIVRALKPKQPMTRSLSRSLTRKIEIIPGKEAEIADRKDLAKIDLTIEFEYDSDRPTPAGSKQLDALAKALRNPELKDFRFMLAGHTDSQGSDTYNQRLSERRAAAVKQFLVEADHIQPSRLATVGFGETRLLKDAEPQSPRNRRVEIINLLQ